ncbi:MAG TPA: pyroglutamyl-peptidase I [Lacunisphaera sp.]|nr:pyroglutamyl-peptidase I [Lacunisphaera sp.]
MRTKPARSAGSTFKPVLVTGFEPFGGEQINPSGEIARQLHGAVIAGHRVTGALLPCVFGAAIRELEKQIATVRPVLVVCVGQAGGRAAITPERVAINVDDARIPDNAGAQPVDRPVIRGGPAAYWSTLPIKAIVAALRRKEIPAAVSQTAGTFVCNHVFYGLMHGLRRQARVHGGFVHVPFLPEQARRGEPSLPLEDMVRAIEIAVAVALRHRRDVRKAGGAEA